MSIPAPSAKTSPLRPRMAPRSTFSFAIVASQYNLEFTQPLVDFAHQELTTLEQGALVQLVWAPGAFEIPVLAKILASHGHHDAVIAFGVIFQGETSHAGLIANSVTHSLQQIAVEYSVPVIDGVLLMDTPEQARERCQGMEKNRGIEAARAAISVARTARELNARL